MHAAKVDLPVAETGEGFESRHAEWGAYTVAFDTQSRADPPEIFEGLPNDKCQCPHWGFVFKGRMVYDVNGVREEFGAGEAFYLPPGHLGIEIAPGTETLEFSPTVELKRTIRHIEERAKQKDKPE
jgi:hypothetical protein